MRLRLRPPPKVGSVPDVPREPRGLGVVGRHGVVPEAHHLQRRFGSNGLADINLKLEEGGLDLAISFPHEAAGWVDVDQIPFNVAHDQPVEFAFRDWEALPFALHPFAELFDPTPALGHAQFWRQLGAKGVHVALRPRFADLVSRIEAPRCVQVHLTQKRRRDVQADAEDDLYEQPLVLCNLPLRLHAQKATDSSIRRCLRRRNF
mmetsp:Transcript_17528/g.43877  ORF Transcript_17528/g.43877 Transcript_17528/m.43877 type:complete len:205 (+) Transcript_17528:172-786(+)